MNQKTRFGSITFILVCIAIEVMQAQDFRPGFMIRENGDSVKGFLVYRNDIYNARSCEFRIDENGKTLIYGPGQIKAFGYTGGKYYQSKLLPTEQEPTTLFALVVIRGSMSLYQFEDTFYIEKSDSIVSLSTKTVRIEQEGKEYDEVIKPYSNVLNKMLADCHMNCNDTGLNNMSLTHLVKKYNRCKGDPVEKSNHHKLSWLAVRTSAFVLSDFSNLKLSYFPKYTIDRSTTVTGGIGISVYSPHVNDRISLIVETSKPGIYLRPSLGITRATCPVELLAAMTSPTR